MIKVFLVEDEVVIREGIKNNIAWEENGFDFCGEASDGELAFPMIQKIKPDIVITDIKMPFMDGLALSTLIKKECPWIEIIILSGFEEFDYAKEAINIGVAQYLTKPISGEDLLTEVKAVSAKIEEKKMDRMLKEKYQKEMEENSMEEKRKLFRFLVSGEKTTSELLEIGSKLNMDLSALWYNVVLFVMQSSHHSQGEYSDSMLKAGERINQILDETGTLVFDRNLDGQAFIIKADSENELVNKQRDIIEKIEAVLADYSQIGYFGGTGLLVNRIHSISDSFAVASHAFAHRYLIQKSTFISGEEITSNIYMGDEDFKLEEVDVKKLDSKNVVQFLKTGNKDEVSIFVDELQKEIGENALKSLIFRQYILMDSYFATVNFLESIGASRDIIPAVDFKSDSLSSVEGVKEYFVNIFSKAIDYRNSSASNRYKETVDEAIQYIEDNYFDEDLSLNTLASVVNVSPNHLSMIFGQQTGVTFIKYLTDLRMDKAKTMLRCTSKRSSEIASAIGYKDPHYFSFIFKKTQGVTPTQYRDGQDDEGAE